MIRDFKPHKIFICFVITVSSFSLQAQLATDLTALPYEVDEVVGVIQEAFEAPTDTNSYVMFISNEPGFPTLSTQTTLNANEVDAIRDWVSTHPESIEKLLIARKKNYDAYFNAQFNQSSN